MGRGAHPQPQPPPQPPHHGPQNSHQVSVAALAFSAARFASMKSATLDITPPGVTAVIRGVPAPLARSATSSLATPCLVLSPSSLGARMLTLKVTDCTHAPRDWCQTAAGCDHSMLLRQCHIGLWQHEDLHVMLQAQEVASAQAEVTFEHTAPDMKAPTYKTKRNLWRKRR